MPTHSDSELNDGFDWDLLVESRLNAISVRRLGIVDFTLTSLRDHLQRGAPAARMVFPGRIAVAVDSHGNMIVTDVAGTTLDEQRAFLAWLDAHHDVRVITLSESPLYGLVRDAGGCFEHLYYRLNPIYCALDRSCISDNLGRSSAA